MAGCRHHAEAGRLAGHDGPATRRQASRLRGPRIRRAAHAAVGAQRARGVGRACPAQPAARRAVAQCVGRKVPLRDHRCAARLGQRARIRRLMIVDRTGQRHQNGRPAGDRQFGHRGGAGARDHQMRRRKLLGHVREERGQFGIDAGQVVRRANPPQVLGPALLHDREARQQRIGQRRQRRRHDIAEHPRAERAAQHQQADRRRRAARMARRRARRSPGAPGCR